VAKRLGLLHDLVPKAIRIAVLVNPANLPNAEIRLQGIREAARAVGLQISIVNASSSQEIDTAFATLMRDRADAVFVNADVFFYSQAKQIATLAAHYGIPAAYDARVYAEVGGLMSYGTDVLGMFHQAGVYTGQILKGAKPADLPFIETTKFEFVINITRPRRAARPIRRRRRADRLKRGIPVDPTGRKRVAFAAVHGPDLL
jgi:putative ABC transport system substrate-binding protein